MKTVFDRLEESSGSSIPKCLSKDAAWPWTHKRAGKPDEYWERGKFQAYREGGGWQIDESGSKIWSGSAKSLCRKVSGRKFI